MSNLARRALAASKQQIIRSHYPLFIVAMLKNDWDNAYQLAHQAGRSTGKVPLAHQVKPDAAKQGIRVTVLASRLLKAHMEENPRVKRHNKQDLRSLAKLLSRLRLTYELQQNHRCDVSI
jgi:hypothetical protein